MIKNVTPNGEVTYNSSTNLYTAWDETYVNILIQTKSMDEALKRSFKYAKELDDGY
jgi:hypothetical protein